jgi:phosphate-selective porin OprO/OprP
MTNFRRTALASVINLAFLGATNVHAADTKALEKRIHELESRLTKMDQLERRLEKLDQAGALSAKPAAAVTAPAAPSPEVVKLTQKVNTLERKLEVQDEVTTSTFQKMPTIEAGSDGFRISSADKQHLLRIGGTVQADGRFFLNNSTTLAYGPKPQYLDNPAGPDSFFIRQGRIILDGYFFKDVNFKLMADFAGSNLLPDAYLDYTYFSQASLLVGKYKPSIGLERLQGDADTVFLERALPSNLAPNRDVGIQVHGGFGMPGYKGEKVVGPIDSKNAFNYQIGFTDGSGDSGNNTTQGTAGPSGNLSSNKEFDARVFAQPFQHSGYSLLEGFGVGLSGSFGDPNHQGINAQRTALGQSQFVDYTKGFNGSSALITSNGATARLSPQGYWYAGPFGLLGEYITSSQHLSVASTTTGAVSGPNNNVNQNNKAYQIQASYVLTGEDNSFSGIKPLRNFDPLKGAWGAWQLAARWSELSMDNQTFRVLDPTQSASKASAWTVGANWFLNKNAIIRTDLEEVMFLGGAGYSTGSGATTKYFISNRPSELVFSTRFQLAF